MVVYGHSSCTHIFASVHADPDYAHQADAYEEWWQAAEERIRILRLTGSYRWDDAMNKRSPARLDPGSTIRNRSAEGVMQRWGFPVRGYHFSSSFY